jgi:AhpD family alkylhydroperoxidase
VTRSRWTQTGADVNIASFGVVSPKPTIRNIGRCALYDKKNLGKLKGLEARVPETMKAFVAFDKAAMSDGAIPRKYKELMALAVAFTTQCPYCIDIHAGNARETGASDQEISEAVMVAAALRAGAAVTHGTHAIKGHE